MSKGRPRPSHSTNVHTSVQIFAQHASSKNVFFLCASVTYTYSMNDANRQAHGIQQLKSFITAVIIFNLKNPELIPKAPAREGEPPLA